MCFTQRYVHFSRFFPAQKNPQRTKIQYSTRITHYTMDRMYLSCCCLIASPKYSPLTYGRSFGRENNNEKKKRMKNNSRLTEDK